MKYNILNLSCALAVKDVKSAGCLRALQTTFGGKYSNLLEYLNTSPFSPHRAIPIKGAVLLQNSENQTWEVQPEFYYCIAPFVMPGGFVTYHGDPGNIWTYDFNGESYSKRESPEETIETLRLQVADLTKQNAILRGQRSSAKKKAKTDKKYRVSSEHSERWEFIDIFGRDVGARFIHLTLKPVVKGGIQRITALPIGEYVEVTYTEDGESKKAIVERIS